MTHIPYTKYILTTALVTAFFAFSAQADDRLTLANGDVISGHITHSDTATIAIQTAYGSLSIPRETITSISAPQNVSSLSSNDEDAQSLAQTEPSAGEQNGLWGAQWTGEVNAGAELETGNKDGSSLLLKGKTTANWDDVHRLGFHADYDREKDNDVKTKDETELGATYDYFFADRWFWNNRLTFEKDKINNLDLRTTATSGLGYQFFKRDDLKLEVTFGPGYEREDYKNKDTEYKNKDTESNMTANWSLDYEQKLYDDLVRIFHNHTLTSPTDELSSYLFESASGVKMPLKSGIVATGEIDFDYNNDPAAGLDKDDTTYRLLLGYEW